MKLPFTCGKGVNRDQLPADLELGVWTDVQNMRFRGGYDERVLGISSIVTPSVAPYGLETFQLAFSTSVSRYIVYVGLTKVYVWDGTTTTEITRGLNGTTNALSGTGVTVTVTSNGHGLTTGDTAIISGVTPVGYNTAAAGVPITVINANQFTYANAETGALTVAGMWETNRTSNFTAVAGDEITTTVLNGILYINTLTDGLYYWPGVQVGGVLSTGPAGRLRRVRVTAGVGDKVVYGRAVRSFRDYLFVLGYLGAGLGAGGFPTSAAVIKKPFDLAWGSSAEPGSLPSTFTAAASNDAGLVQKTHGSLVDAEEFNGEFFIFQDQAIIDCRWTGGNQVFDFDYVGTTDGVLAPNCIVNTPKGQVYFSQNRDVRIHQGGVSRSLSEGRNLNWIRTNIDATYHKRSFLVVNKRFSEVWVCIPTTGNSTCTKALIWNWDSDTWGERDLSGVTCGASGMIPETAAIEERLFLGTTTPRLGLVDSGTTDFGSTYTSSVERIGIHGGAPRMKKTLEMSIVNADATAGNVATISHGSHRMPDAAASYQTGVTYTQGTTRDVNAFAVSAEYAAWKLTTTASDWRHRAIELELTEDGEY